MKCGRNQLMKVMTEINGGISMKIMEKYGKKVKNWRINRKNDAISGKVSY